MDKPHSPPHDSGLPEDFTSTARRNSTNTPDGTCAHSNKWHENRYLRSSSTMVPANGHHQSSVRKLDLKKMEVIIRYGVTNLQGKRKTQEDSHKASTDVTKDPVPDEMMRHDNFAVEEDHFAFFGVYDGHGGRAASDFVATHLHNYLRQERVRKEDPVEALRAAMIRAESEFAKLAKENNYFDGTTACVVVITSQGSIVTGNIGDSEVVLSRAGKAIPLSSIHNPKKNADELERIQNEGGKIWNDRVAHPNLNPAFFSIAVSRAIGDIYFKDPSFTEGKPSGLSAEPQVTTRELTKEDEFCVLACDGLWDVMTHQEVVDFVLPLLKELNDPQEVSSRLAHKALEKGSTDNITALVITFQDFSKKQ